MQQLQQKEMALTRTRVQAANKGMARTRLRTTMQAYLFLLPSFIGLLFFLILPILAVAVLSFFNWGMLTTPRFVGLANYNILLHSPIVGNSILVTAYYVLLNIPAQTILSTFARAAHESEVARNWSVPHHLRRAVDGNAGRNGSGVAMDL